MPTYADSFDIQNGEKKIKIHVFNYTNPVEDSAPKKKGSKGSKGPKQLICVASCMYFGTRNITTLDEESKASVLKTGQEYDGFYVRTKNGTYDYCYKIWTDRRLPFPPLNYPAPKEEEVHDIIIIDKNKDYFGLAYGPHLAYCTKKELQDVGISLKNISYPFGAGRAKLIRDYGERPNEIPYAAYRAYPVPIGTSEGESEYNVEVEEEEEEGYTRGEEDDDPDVIEESNY